MRDTPDLFSLLAYPDHRAVADLLGHMPDDWENATAIELREAIARWLDDWNAYEQEVRPRHD